MSSDNILQININNPLAVIYLAVDFIGDEIIYCTETEVKLIFL